MKIAGNVKDSAFMYNGLHFPQTKSASEKPPEAVLEGVVFKIFLGEHPPHTPTLWPSLNDPHPLFFVASYGLFAIYFFMFSYFLFTLAEHCMYVVYVKPGPV